MNMSVQETVTAIIKENKRILPGVIAIAILISLLAVRWGYSRHMANLEEIAALEELYRSSLSLVERGEGVSKVKEESEARIREREKGLLKAGKPSVAAAELVEAFKSLASKRGIVISSQRSLSAVDKAGYTRVPVEFQFKTELSRLKDLLYDIQTSPVLMGVTQLKIKVSEQKEGGKLDVQLVVDGAIRKGKA